MKPKFTVYIIVRKSISSSFDAVYNPRKLKKYFTTKMASGPLDQGTTVNWEFADFPGAFPVHVKKMVKNKKIAFEWEAASGKYNTQTTFNFKRMGPSKTKIEVTETGWKNNHKGFRDSYGNCMGWSQMLCCLKAYLEYGINLRSGSYK